LSNPVTAPLISVPAQNNSTWTQRTADISQYIGHTARLIILYQSGSSFRGDIQLDDFNIGGNTFDPETGTHDFQVQTTADNSQLSDVNDIYSDYNAVSWTALTTDSLTHESTDYGKFFRDSGGTPSGGTGNTSGNTGSFYYFVETTSTGSNNDVWLRSPEVTITNGTLEFYTAQNGSNSGPIYAYLELTGPAVSAGWGRGTWSSDAFGTNDSGGVTTGWGRSTWSDGPWGRTVTAVALTGIQSASSAGSVTVAAEASASPSGIQSSSSAGSVSVVAEASASPSGIQSGSSAGSVSTVGEANVPLTGIQSSTSAGNVDADPDANITGIQASSSSGSVSVQAEANVSATGIQATSTAGSATASATFTVELTGQTLRTSNADLAGAFNAEYFVPTDSGDPNVTVVAYEDSTTVSSDGSSLGTISSAGGTLTVSASDYENKLISANKPITLQSANNETTGVPTSWQGTSFGFRNTRTGVRLQFRSISGTATVEIFKDGSLETTLSVPDNTTTIQTYADDTSNPEYQIFSDLPIVGFKSSNASFADTHPLFPATREIYGFASGSGTVVKVEDYGSSASYVEFRSNNQGGTSSTISTFKSTGGTASDYTGPSVRVVAGADVAGFAISDGDGGEKTSWIPEGCFAHEFRLIEAAEFLAIMGAPGTKGRNINVFDSSGNLIDTVQLDADTTDADFPTKFQLVSNSTTDSNLTPIAKSYDLTAGMRIVSEVPVGVIVEDNSSDNEENLFGLRFFNGFVTGEAIASATGIQSASSAGSVSVVADASASLTGIQSTTSAGAVDADPDANITGIQASSTAGSVSVVGESNVSLTGIQASSTAGDSSISADANTSTTGIQASSSIGTCTVAAEANTSPSGVQSSSSEGSVTVVGVANVSTTGIQATSSEGDVSVSADASTALTGIQSSTSAGNVDADPDANITGIQATTSAGTVSVLNDMTVFPTGIQSATTAGNVDADPDANVIGIQASSSAGSVSVSAEATTSPSGLQSSTSEGSVSLTITSSFTTTGIQSATSEGDTSVSANADVDTTGIQGSTAVGSVAVSAQASVTSTGIQSATTAGGVSVSINQTVVPTGIQASTTVGSVTISGSANVVPIGIALVISAESANVWGPVDESQTSNFVAVNTAQTPNYSVVSDGNVPNWSEISGASDAGFSQVSDGNTPNWEEVA